MDFYQILGVSQTAHIADIKRAYRRLAILYHPDKNPDPNAVEVFKKINEAYHVLGDASSRAAYDLRNAEGWANVLQQTPPARHRDPRYRPDPKRKSQGQEMYEMMAGYVRYAKYILQVGFLFCMILVADYGLPSREYKETVTQAYFHRGHSRRGETYRDGIMLRTSSGKEVLINLTEAHAFQPGDSLIRKTTALFHIPVKIMNRKGYAVRTLVTIYGYYVFAPLILLVLTTLGLFYMKGVVQQFNLGVVTAFVIILNLFFLFIHTLW
ncbi:MAG: J domain-containing protein [Cyclobacteriaceae bacterium]|nr:J domain-containing protein [Cyclobacteriaceae bacterium]